MSFLSEELTRQLNAASWSVDHLSSKCKISRGQIYKWLNADQTSINAHQLDAISTALSGDQNDHAALLIAHLKDETLGTAANLVRIEMESPLVMKDKIKPKTKREKAIHFLAEESVLHKSVQDLVIDLAKVLGAEL